MRWFLLWVVLPIVVFMAVIVVSMLFGQPIVLALYLLFGWGFFLARVIGQVQMNWAAAASAIVALAAFVAGAHLFLRWFASARRPTVAAPPGDGRAAWRFRWTLQGTAIIVMMFVAGISMIGVTHQTAWLFSSKEPMWQYSRLAARRTQSANNVKQTGLALLNWNEHHGALPAGSTADRQGRMLHSWMTAMLPYLDQMPLYSQIDGQQPWDSPRNAPFFKIGLAVFSNPSVDDTRADGAGLALCHYAGNVYVLGGTEPRKLADSPKGLGKTILYGEAAGDFSAWGRPGNWRDPNLGLNQSPQGFGGDRGDHITAFAMADGSVRQISDDIDPAVLKALADPDSRAPIPDDAIR